MIMAIESEFTVRRTTVAFKPDVELGSAPAIPRIRLPVSESPTMNGIAQRVQNFE